MFFSKNREGKHSEQVSPQTISNVSAPAPAEVVNDTKDGSDHSDEAPSEPQEKRKAPNSYGELLRLSAEKRKAKHLKRLQDGDKAQD